MKTSKGEEKIIKLLSASPFKFEREKSFKDLKSGYYRFDFYLPEARICIEVDGLQHFIHTKYFHKTRQDFLKAKERDRRKNSYCLANGIKLFRIPYWDIDSINHYFNLFQDKYLVKNKYHNDNL